MLALESCGYPNLVATSTINHNTERKKRGTLVTIPYSAGVSERIKNTYKVYGICAALKLVNKLRSRLVHVNSGVARAFPGSQNEEENK